MNHLSWRAGGRTPVETLAGLDTSDIKMEFFHTFGSPCYVLDCRLQSGQGMIPEWDPRSIMGIYVGRSPAHASNVALVLNPRTGHVSPQFHVVFDDEFTTVPYLRKGQVPPYWEKIVRNPDTFSRVDNRIDTWDSLQQPEKAEEGDISSNQDRLPVVPASEGAQST